MPENRLVISTDALSLWTSHSGENSSTRASGSTNHCMISHSTMPVSRSLSSAVALPHTSRSTSSRANLPSPMSASRTGFTTRKLLDAWKPLAGHRPTAAPRAAAFQPPYSCHWARITRELLWRNMAVSPRRCLRHQRLRIFEIDPAYGELFMDHPRGCCCCPALRRLGKWLAPARDADMTLDPRIPLISDCNGTAIGNAAVPAGMAKTTCIEAATKSTIRTYTPCSRPTMTRSRLT